jgi:exodeoxyribonuclease VII small subunit
MSEPTNITFESGYRRLQAISERVNSDEVPVHEMCDLFAEGKGLATALTGYLDEQKARVEAIERGDEIQAFKVVAPSGEPVADPAPGAGSGDPPQLGDEEIPF